MIRKNSRSKCLSMLSRCSVSSVKFSFWVNSSLITLSRAIPIRKHQGHTFSRYPWKFRLPQVSWLRRSLTKDRIQSSWFWLILITSRGRPTKSTKHSACCTNHSSISTHPLLSHRQVTNSRTKRQHTPSSLPRTAVRFWKVTSEIWRWSRLLRNQTSWNVSSESVTDSLNCAARSSSRTKVFPGRTSRLSAIFLIKKAFPTHSKSKMRPSQGWSATHSLKVSTPHEPTSNRSMMKFRSHSKPRISTRPTQVIKIQWGGKSLKTTGLMTTTTI